MGFFDFLKEPTKDELYEVEYDIYSATYLQDEISKYVEKAGVINNRYITEEYDKNSNLVYKYNPIDIKNYRFEKDPKNQHDKNAIKIIASSGLTVCCIGYIPQESNVKFAKLMKENKIYNVNLSIVGGPRKIISKNEDVVNDDMRFYVRLKILFRK